LPEDLSFVYVQKPILSIPSLFELTVVSANSG